MRTEHAGARTYRPEQTDHAEITNFAAALDRASAMVAAKRPVLVAADGTQSELPAPIFEALVQVTTAMARRQLVTVVPGEQLLTTQQAADRLAISRPTLVRLLAEGQMPFEYRGHHRRVRLADVLAYEQQRPRRQHWRRSMRAGR